MEPDDKSGFDWDKHIAGHIAKHNIRAEEMEQVLLNSPIPVTEEIHNGEERFLDIGHTQVASRQEREEYYAQKGMET